MHIILNLPKSLVGFQLDTFQTMLRNIHFAYIFTIPQFYAHFGVHPFVYSKCTPQVYTLKHTL